MLNILATGCQSRIILIIKFSMPSFIKLIQDLETELEFQFKWKFYTTEELLLKKISACLALDPS